MTLGVGRSFESHWKHVFCFNVIGASVSVCACCLGMGYVCLYPFCVAFFCLRNNKKESLFRGIFIKCTSEKCMKFYLTPFASSECVYCAAAFCSCFFPSYSSPCFAGIWQCRCRAAATEQIISEANKNSANPKPI